MRMSRSALPVIGGAALLLAGCSTAFETPTTLSSDAQLVPGERRLVPVMEYADGEALAGLSALHLPLVEIAPGAEVDDDLDSARLDRLRAVLSKEICQRFARGGFSVLPEPDEGAATARLSAAVTGLRRNNVATTGLSRVIGTAVPGPLNPRVPIGIGALGAEGEILTEDGTQLAAIRWASQNHLASGGGFTTVLDGPAAFGDLVVEARAGYEVSEGETPRGTCDAYFDQIGQDEDDAAEAAG